MGGKNKQRTKGNVRPSSSGRAADLLAREGGVVPGFVGFGLSTSTDPGYVPAVHGAEDIDSLVDADFRLVLRKLSKRDTVTKLKAVQEFGAMCQEREPDVVKGVLPYWPRIYCRISVDHDRRVREAAQQAFEQLILKVKRNLAPYLKSIMGHWLIAQCDTYTPAASAAAVAFQAAFPPNKQAEALSFCKDEILTVLQDNLLKETAETLSDPQNVPEEEREAKYVRLLTSSLLALKRLLTQLSPSDRQALNDRLAHLLTQGKFWKYSKHKTPQVRGALFELVACLCELMPELVQSESARVCSCVLLSIDDTDPVVLPPLWAAVLHVVSGVKDCWTHVSAKKGVLPKLWVLLKEGGHGLATALHPNLLPFISQLPPDVTMPPLDFYTAFFSNIIQGLSSERALSSPSESAAIVVATVECVRYCLLQYAGEEQEDRQLQHLLISQQLLPLMDKALDSPSLQMGPLFAQVALMLLSWEKRATTSALDLPPGGSVDPTATRACFRRALSDFWEGLGDLCLRRVDLEEPDPRALEGIATLLRVLQNPEAGSGRRVRGSSRKKAVKISFAGLEAKESGEDGGEAEAEVEEDVVTSDTSTTDSLVKETMMGPRTGEEEGLSPQRSQHCGNLEELVCQLAEVNMVHVTECTSSECHLRFLSALLRSFPTRRIFSVLLLPGEPEGVKDSQEEEQVKPLGLGKEELERNPAVRFLFLQVIGWLREEGRRDKSFLVEMVFSALHCCPSRQDKTRLLDHITTMELEWGVVLQIIQKASADAVCIEEYGGWLKGQVLGKCLLGLAAVLCERGLQKSPSSSSSSSSPSSSSHSSSWALISLVLSRQHNNETLIGKEYVEKIIDKLHSTLFKAKGMSDAGDLEPLVAFISEVAANFFSSVRGCLLLSSAEELLLTVFQLCAQDQSVTCLSDVLLQKLRQACSAGVRSLVPLLESHGTDGSFLQSAAQWVKSQLLTSPLGLKSLQVLVRAVENLVETLCSAPQNPSAHLSQFLVCLSPSEEEWRKSREALPQQWIQCPLLAGRLRMLCPQTSAEAWRCPSPTHLPAHLCSAALLAKVMCTAAKPRPNCHGDAQERDEVHQQELELPPLKHTVAEILYALQWCSEMEHSPAILSDFHKLLQKWSLPSQVSTITTDMLQTLFTRSVTEGSLWSLTLSSYLQSTHTPPTDVKALYGNPESFFPLTEKSVSTLQVLCVSLPEEEQEALVALAIADLLNWQENYQNVWANVAALNCCLATDTPVQSEVLHAALATIMEWRSSREDWMLFDSDLVQVPPQHLSLTVEVMRFLSWLISHSPTTLQEAQWDFLLCAALAWLETAIENKAAFWNPWVQLFVCETCHLIVALNEFFIAPPADVLEQLPPGLCTEWKEFSCEGINTLLLPLLVAIPEQFHEPDSSEVRFPMAVVRAVGAALTHIPLEQLVGNKLPARLVADQRSNLPDALQTLLNTLTPLLLFKARPLQLTVYHMLNKVMPVLPERDGESSSSRPEEEDGEEPSLSPPAALMSLLAATEDLLESMLGGVQVGEFAVVQPLSVEHCCILGYLLAWNLLLTFFKASAANLRVQYSQFLKKNRSLHHLLLHLFRLMPENPVLPGQGIDAGGKEAKTFFTEPLSLSVVKTDSLQLEVPHLACVVYFRALQDLPAMVRLWCNSQEKRVSSAVDKFTSRHVSSVLSAQEIAAVHASTQTFPNMTVKARTATREVVATYSVDDIFIELLIQLPPNYPLGSIAVESGRRVGVAVQLWRNWMLQLSTYLTHQNGSIMEGLSLWKTNVDKRFEGVEDCMICFSVIHGSNYSLPKKACRTCKKKFHSACLYKWFTSSNKSTCPLCRETFF